MGGWVDKQIEMKQLHFHLIPKDWQGPILPYMYSYIISAWIRIVPRSSLTQL